ncbi:MAG: hypothetical protein ACLVJ6_06640 [Merdibacter sp.]
MTDTSTFVKTGGMKIFSSFLPAENKEKRLDHRKNQRIADR